MIKSFRSLFIILALLCGSAVGLWAAEPPPEDAAFADKLLTAIQKSDYDMFIADGEAAFKQVNKAQFEVLTIKLAKKLQAGHTITYLGDMNQKGNRVTLWKISFKDGSDDELASLKIKNGKVLSFFVRG